MIPDKNLMISEAQEVLTTGYGTGIDFNAAAYANKNPRIRCVVNTTYSDGTSVAFAVVTNTTNTWDGTETTLSSVTAIVVATLAAGYVVFDIEIPRGMLRYGNVKYTVSGSPTAGAFDTYCLPDSPYGQST